MVEYVSAMYTYNINLQCGQLVEAGAAYVRVMPQTQACGLGALKWQPRNSLFEHISSSGLKSLSIQHLKLMSSFSFLLLWSSDRICGSTSAEGHVIDLYHFHIWTEMWSYL